MVLENPCFILIRGLAREARHWMDFPSTLKIFFPNCEIETLDHAGNGSEIGRESATDIVQTVEDLRNRSKFLRDKKRPILVAVSLGGMIATKWASTYPQELSGLVLMNSSDGGTAPFYERLLPRAQINFLSIFFKKDPLEIELAALPMISNRPENYHKWATEFVDIPRTSVKNFVRQVFSASKMRFPKTPPAIPILLLTSYGDRLVSWRCSQKISQLWNLPLEIHPDSGHDITLDDPAWVCERILAWMQEPTQNLPLERPSIT